MTTTHDTTVLPETHEPTRMGRIERIKQAVSRDYHHWSYNPFIPVAIIVIGAFIGWIIWAALRHPPFVQHMWPDVLMFITVIGLVVGIPLLIIGRLRDKNPPIISETPVVSESTDS